MKKTFKIVGALLLIGFLFSPITNLIAQTNNLSGTEDYPPEIHILSDGTVKAQGVKVIQFAGSTMFTRFIWKQAFLRLTIKTDAKTEITRRYGGALKLSDIAVGDWIVIEGNLELGADSLSLNATKIKDVSIFTQDEVRISGTVTETIGGGSTLKIFSKEKGSVEFTTDGNTRIKKGSLMIAPKDVVVGDRITSAQGVFDTVKKSMTVHSMEVYINTSIFVPQNFQGKLVSIAGTNLPTTITVEISGQNYTVKLNEKTAVMRASRAPVVLGRFVIGDTIRLYGNTTEENHSVIDNVLVVRNISL